MPLISLKSTVFDAFEDMLTFPQVDLTYADALDTIASGSEAGDPTVLQLSSGLIRISQPLWEWAYPQSISANYELRISGSGIGPVSTMDALIAAIDQGFAVGTLNNIQIFREGTKVLELAMGASGYVFSTGSLSVTLNGHLPLTFGQISEFVDLFSKAVDIYSLTRGERLALFDDLSAYGVSGLDVTDGTTELFAFNVTATAASLTVNGLTFSVTGTFPTNFGEDLQLLWQISRQFDQTGTVDFSTLTGLAVTGLEISDASGHVLAAIANPLDETPTTWNVDGRSFDEVLMNGMEGNLLVGSTGSTRSVLAGLGGNDDLYGGGATDFLFGGSGKDDLFGGAGSDRLTGGADRDDLTGGGRADVFVFAPRGGLDRITDFVSGLDVIEIRSANRMSDLVFTDLGTDVRVDFNTVHFIVENIEIGTLRHVENFLF